MGGAAVIKHVHFVPRRLASGNVRWHIYAWRGGPNVATHDGRKRPTLSAAEVDAVATAIKKRHDPDTTTLRYLIRAWRSENPERPSSPEWEKLSANTKKTWGSQLNRIEEKWGDVPLALFNDPRMIQKIVAWRDSRRATPRAADLGIDVLKALLKYGVHPLALLDKNIAAGITKIYGGGQREEIVWTDEDLLKFERAARELNMLPAWDALRLAATTGFRRDDLVTLNDAQVGKFAVVKKAKKSSRRKRRFATMPRIPELDAVLNDLARRPRAEGITTILVTAEGRPWHPDTLSKAIARVRDHAGIIHIDEETGKVREKHLHDARGTFATKLMTQTDLNDAEIADIMAWSPEQVSNIRRVYVDQTARIVAVGRRISGAL